ncbi:MAG: type IX secretion system plug protein domain-containing protein [Balneolaceae bacterium]
MKEPFISKLRVLLLITLLLSCESSLEVVQNQPRRIQSQNSLLLVPNQIPLPQSIKGVQFFRRNYPGSPPVIRLNTDDQLQLRFDELSPLSGQFTVSFEHYSQNWERSGLAEIWVYDGVNDLPLVGGSLNEQSSPNYFSYQYRFPNRDIDFLVSGNYLMTISDYESGTELFSLPFFVTENEGELNPDIETFFNSGPLGSAMDQISGTYFYPDFIEFPQFNLSYKVSQNRFWRDNVSPKQTNFDTDGKTSFRLTRDQFLPAYVEFDTLDLRRLNLQNPQIFGYDRAQIPERVILRNDYFNFSSDVRTITETGFGRPVLDSDSRILNVEFRYETQGALPRNSKIYLIGDFNQWTIKEQFKLNFDTEERVFKVNAIIKQGVYNYIYAIVEEGKINPLRNLETLSQKPQEYASFVYYKDPQLQYDRLLNTRIFYSE